MKKIISYSLYGANPFYTHGAIVNVEQIQRFYPHWICRFYVGNSVPQEVIQRLINLGAEVVPMQGEEDYLASLWRFYAFADPDVEFVLLRDTDSRFSAREVCAVQEWIKSGKSFHIMRDHPEHTMPIMGGMWGAKCSALRDIETLLEKKSQKNRYGADQFFLRKMLYPRAKNDACIHASFWMYETHAKPFPTPRENCEFVGERINENEQPFMSDRKMIEKFQNIWWRKAILAIKLFLKKNLLNYSVYNVKS